MSAADQSPTISDDAVEKAARAMRSIVPNSDDVLWTYNDADMETGDDLGPHPVTLADAARAALAAAAPTLTADAITAERARAERAETALLRLVELKDGPRDQHYFDTKETAWAEGRRVLMDAAMAARIARTAPDTRDEP